MVKAFLKFLGGEQGEEKQMLLLLGKGFFMGILLATYQIGAETLFLTVMGDEWLDVAFFTAGGAGIISAALFVFLQRKINFSTLVISTTFVILLFIGGIRAAFEFIGYDNTISGEFQIIPFILFVMIGPVTSIILLGFWGVFGRVFDLRQSKRIIGGIDTGQLMATMIAFFSIPILTNWVIDQTYDLLFVSAIASFGVFIFTLLLAINYNLDKATKVIKGEEVQKVSFFTLMKDKYLRLLSIFLIFSMGAAVFVNYTFLSATETMYPDEKDLSNFLSFFSGTVIVVSFLIQSFINDIIIGKFGLRVALMTMPLILILFTVGAIVVGHIFGYQSKTDEFIMFFVLTAVGKLFTASLKDALENPAFKLFFLPLDIKIRFDIQTRIEGVVNEIATFLAGGAQMALGLLVFFELIHYSYFILVLAAGVIYLAGKLFEEYKRTLKTTLEKQKASLEGQGKRNENNTLSILKDEIVSKDVDQVLTALRLFEKLEPIEFEFVLLDLLNHRKPILRSFAYKKLGDRLCWEAIDIIEKDLNTEGNEKVLKVAKASFQKLKEAAEFKLTDVSIKELVRSTDATDRERGARLLAKATEDRHIAFIVELLRDINPNVRSAAMITAGKVKRPELWPILIENLHLSTYGNVAMSALKASGEAAFHTVDTAFYKTGQYHATMLRIIQVLGRIGGRGATELLWKKIDYPDRKIVSQLLLSLSYIGFVARDFQSARIKIAIEGEIGDIAWNIKSSLEIPDEDPVDSLIKEAMSEEDVKNYQNIFMLLGMIYDPQSVLLAKENIQNGTTESITFAVEMMDIFIDEELKDKLLPVMDELKIHERLAKLQNHYPPEYFDSYEDLLLQIINRDYNRLNRYTKALAMYRFSQISTHVTADLIANLFNPDPFLLQTAALSIYRINKDSYHEHTKRLRPITKKELDRAILPPVFRHEDEEYHQKLLLIERVVELKKIEIFKSIPGELITYMAECLEEVRVKLGSTIIREGDSGMEPMYIVLEGSVDIYEGDHKVAERERGGVFGEKNVTETDTFSFTALARTECTLLLMRKEELLNLMSRHIDILDCWVDIMNGVAEEDEPEIVDVLFG
ncbi:ATP/ADP translocase [Ekhidna lutea]|uniref:ATP/ADP translocase n=1 Tax=Ekhidna lutea TaxID=447679 RepID=A0A239GHZ9_EKHLU|nr:cyclic nucleotide-binding domain-containing protein [Ekhidna lutea]SNS68651.1 ATP/ADP translocase [Ekhidna lutea]